MLLNQTTGFVEGLKPGSRRSRVWVAIVAAVSGGHEACGQYAVATLSGPNYQYLGSLKAATQFVAPGIGSRACSPSDCPTHPNG